MFDNVQRLYILQHAVGPIATRTASVVVGTRDGKTHKIGSLNSLGRTWGPYTSNTTVMISSERMQQVSAYV